MEEFQHQLEKKASADAKLFGFKFSGSYSHEETSTILNSGEYKIVLSNAECHYYSTSLNIYSLPPFSEEVVSWLEKFNNTIGSQAQYELILMFMDYFGTHVPVKMIYGASYTNVDKLTNDNYKSLEQKGSPSVNTQASFASLFSIDSNLQLPDSQKQQITKFQSLTETITKTVGPPPGGKVDPSTWSSSVQKSPAPIKYMLTPISNLLTYKNLKTVMSEDTVSQLQDRFREYELKYCDYLSKTRPFARCKLSTTTLSDSDDMRVYIYGLIAIAGGMKYSIGRYYASSYNLDRCVSMCESISICAVVEWESGQYCYLAAETDFPQNATLSVIDPSQTVVILQNHLTQNTRLLALQYDTTATRGKRFKISHDGKTYTRLRDGCGEFCRLTDGCRGFEVSGVTDLSYDCVLYEQLGRSYWTNRALVDFETTFLALSPKIKKIKDSSVTLDIKMAIPNNTFKVQPGCTSDDCCSKSCLHGYHCLVSAFDTFADTCYHMHVIHSSFEAKASGAFHPFSLTVFPERVPTGSVVMTGYSFPDARFSEFYGVYSSDECVNICAANARCTTASWSGRGAGKCVLHDNKTIRLSNRVVQADAGLVFPTVPLRMRATELDIFGNTLVSNKAFKFTNSYARNDTNSSNS